ncbi:MAG: class I SAM-dependent methyltransferase [Methylomonas sp.]|nr:class I SAM-dependent methyltransferase [Methylomonas sp.]
MYQEKREDYFSTARTVILDMLPDRAERVMEIGCGSGETLAFLKKNGVSAETVGIELNDAAAKKAENIVDKVVCIDVEKQSIPYDLGKFQLILLLDVLEHLVDPWSFLEKLRRDFLADRGKVIISLPNARHFSMVLPLLLGRFDYQERGILDKTHLRFFTKSSMLELISGAGLEVEKFKRTSLEANLNSGKLNIMTLGLFSEFLTSQYIFCCSAADQT